VAIAAAQTTVGTFAVTSSATLAQAYGSNVVAGNLLVVRCGWGSSSQTCSVSGSLNGAFTAIAGSLATNATAPFRAQVFYKVAASSGAETITMTCSGSNTQREIVIEELSGASSTQPDSSTAATGNSTNPTASITIVAQPGWISAYAMSTAGTISVGATYTSDLSQNGDLGQHKAYSATGATSVPTVDASIGQWVVSAAAFNEAAAAAAEVQVNMAPVRPGGS
jgi:hypothetical protein